MWGSTLDTPLLSLKCPAQHTAQGSPLHTPGLTYDVEGAAQAAPGLLPKPIPNIVDKEGQVWRAAVAGVLVVEDHLEALGL